MNTISISCFRYNETFQLKSFLINPNINLYTAIRVNDIKISVGQYKTVQNFQLGFKMYNIITIKYSIANFLLMMMHREFQIQPLVVKQTIKPFREATEHLRRINIIEPNANNKVQRIFLTINLYATPKHMRTPFI